MKRLYLLLNLLIFAVASNASAQEVPYLTFSDPEITPVATLDGEFIEYIQLELDDADTPLSQEPRFPKFNIVIRYHIPNEGFIHKSHIILGCDLDSSYCIKYKLI